MAFQKGFAMLMVLMCVSEVCMGAVYKVGDKYGWTDSGKVDYKAWASSKTFRVGDTIVFEYDNRFSNLVRVNHHDYSNCINMHPYFSLNSGNDSFVIPTTGHYYFITGLPGHCEDGQKVDIRVPRDTTTPAPSHTPTQAPKAQSPTSPQAPAQAPTSPQAPSPKAQAPKAQPPTSPQAPAQAPTSPQAPAPKAQAPTSPQAPAPKAQTPTSPQAPAPKAQAPTSPQAPAPQTPTSPQAPAPKAQTPTSPQAPASQTPTSPQAPAPQTPTSPQAPAPKAQTPPNPEASAPKASPSTALPVPPVLSPSSHKKHSGAVSISGMWLAIVAAIVVSFYGFGY